MASQPVRALCRSLAGGRHHPYPDTLMTDNYVAQLPANPAEGTEVLHIPNDENGNPIESATPWKLVYVGNRWRLVKPPA